MSAPPCTRRTLLVGAGAAAAAATTGCGAASGETGTTGGDVPLAGDLSDVPVGGGTVFADERVVVTRPEPAVLHAFSAVCPHQGCTVAGVRDGLIVCPCHGSAFGATDGAVARGPATTPLRRREVVVEGAAFRVG